LGMVAFGALPLQDLMSHLAQHAQNTSKPQPFHKTPNSFRVNKLYHLAICFRYILVFFNSNNFTM
jgi:hypothetical protein